MVGKTGQPPELQARISSHFPRKTRRPVCPRFLVELVSGRAFGVVVSVHVADWNARPAGVQIIPLDPARRDKTVCQCDCRIQLYHYRSHRPRAALTLLHLDQHTAPCIGHWPNISLSLTTRIWVMPNQAREERSANAQSSPAALAMTARYDAISHCKACHAAIACKMESAVRSTGGR